MVTKISESENAVKKGLTELAEPMSPLCISNYDKNTLYV